jgi:WXG100 family type VII secretion target
VPVELRVCGSMLGQISDDVHAEMGVLRREMDELLTGGWQGAAAEGFARGWDQWLRGATDVVDGLGSMGRLLGESGQTYQGVDAASAENVMRPGLGL